MASAVTWSIYGNWRLFVRKLVKIFRLSEKYQEWNQGMYRQAHECFDAARGNLSGEGYSNPFIMLRLGECCLEIGDEKNAAEYLLRAYMMEGRVIFEPD